MEEGETEAGEVVGQKRRSPIVWRTPPKVPKLARDPLLDDENDEHRGDPEPSTLERPASRADGRIQSPYPAPEPSPLTAKRGKPLLSVQVVRSARRPFCWIILTHLQ